MIQSVLEQGFEQGDIYASQFLAWMCTKDYIDKDDKICTQVSKTTLPLHRNYGGEIHESLNAYLNVLGLPATGQIIELGANSSIRLIKNTNKNPKNLSKQESKRQKNIEKLISFTKHDNPFAQFLLGNIAWETSKNLNIVEFLYDSSATHPFPLGMKTYLRFCSKHPEYCTNQKVRQKVKSEFTQLEQDPCGRSLAKLYYDPSSKVYQIWPERNGRFAQQWALYRHLYGTGDSLAMVNYYRNHQIDIAVKLTESERLKEATLWLNHAINFHYDEFDRFTYDADEKKALQENLASFYEKIILGPSAHLLSGKAKVFIVTYLIYSKKLSPPKTRELTLLNNMESELLSHIDDLPDLHKCTLLHRLAISSEWAEDFATASTLYRKAQTYAELGRMQALANHQQVLAEKALQIKITSGFHEANADLLARNFTRSTRDKIEETLCFGEEKIKRLFFYFIFNTELIEDIRWAIDLLESGRIPESSIPSEEQDKAASYISEVILPKFLKTESKSIYEGLENPAEGEDFSGFVKPKTKPGRTKLILENFENFKSYVKKHSKYLGDYEQVEFDSIYHFMSGSLLELATQNQLGGIRNFVAASNEEKIRAYNIPSTSLLQFKGTPSLEFDGAFWDASRGKYFWYDVKSLYYSRDGLDFENILEGLKKHRDLANQYGAEFLFISKNRIPRKIANILEKSKINYLAIFP